MVTQEEKAIKRIHAIASILKESKEMYFDDLAAWTLVNQGITDKTTGRYVNALTKLGMISFNTHDNTIRWIREGLKTGEY